MKPNYLDWDQKGLAMVFCDFYLTDEIMVPRLCTINENVIRLDGK